MAYYNPHPNIPLINCKRSGLKFPDGNRFGNSVCTLCRSLIKLGIGAVFNSYGGRIGMGLMGLYGGRIGMGLMGLYGGRIGMGWIGKGWIGKGWIGMGLMGLYGGRIGLNRLSYPPSSPNRGPFIFP